MTDRLFGITDTGKVRENNEDVFIAEEVMDGRFMLAGVIDGVGGYAGGEVAAALTREVILRELSVISEDPTGLLVSAFNEANEQIVMHKQGDLELLDMACVATMAVVDRGNNLLHYIHVGDTRLYLFRDHSLVKISHDQSFVGFLEDSGRLTEEAAMQHPKRNQINQALGLGSRKGMTDPYFETGTSPFLPGDLILICSDGLTDLVDAALITAVLNSSEKLAVKAERLVEEANRAGGKDNITVVLARNDKAPVVQENIRVEKTHLVPHSPKSVGVEHTSVLPKFSQNKDADKQKSSKGLLFLLSGLCLLFLGTTIWLFFYHSRVGSTLGQPDTALVSAQHPVVNKQEKLIRDTLLKMKGDTLLLSDAIFKEPIHLSQPLTINKDTLILQTKGNIVFQSDSAYKGPAFILSPNCKYVRLEQMSLENFQTGIVSSNRALELKNVRFNKIKQPLQVSFIFTDHSFVSGRVSKRSYAADSLAKK